MILILVLFDTFRWVGSFAVKGKDVVVYSELIHTHVRELPNSVQLTTPKDMAT